MKILIVCTGNTCRSPMAEGIFKSLAKEKDMDIQVQSAGTFAFDGDKASPNGIMALESLNIDISNHKSRLIHHNLIEEMDLILTMGSSHKELIEKKFPQAGGKVFLLNEYAFGEKKDVIDPYGGKLKTYEIVRDEIYKAVEAIVAKLSR